MKPKFRVTPGVNPRPDTYEEFVRLPFQSIVEGEGDHAESAANFEFVEGPTPSEDWLLWLKKKGFRLEAKPRYAAARAAARAMMPNRQPDEVASYAASGKGHTLAKLGIVDNTDCYYHWYKVVPL